MIETWAITIVSLLIGFALGVFTTSEEKKEQLRDATQRFVRRIKKQKIGAITPLPPEELSKSKRLRETEEAMEESLKGVLPRVQ